MWIIALLPACLLMMLLYISIRRRAKTETDQQTVAAKTPILSVTPYRTKPTSKHDSTCRSAHTSIYGTIREPVYGSFCESVTPRIDPPDLEFLSRGVDPDTEHGQSFEVRQMNGAEFVRSLKYKSNGGQKITLYWDKDRGKLVFSLKDWLKKKE